MKPFVKWAGGKRQILSRINEYIKDYVGDATEGYTYIEPFLGGGAVFFGLKPKNAILNDLNTDLINAYRVIKSQNCEELITLLEHHSELYKEDSDGYYYDICYWRKCSCIRDSILNNIFNEYNSAGGIFEIDKPNQIEQIQDILIYHLLNPEAWRSAIWTLDEACRNIAQCIINLTWLKNFMIEHVGIKIIFYDSF